MLPWSTHKPPPPTHAAPPLAGSSPSWIRTLVYRQEHGAPCSHSLLVTITALLPPPLPGGHCSGNPRTSPWCECNSAAPQHPIFQRPLAPGLQRALCGALTLLHVHIAPVVCRTLQTPCSRRCGAHTPFCMFPFQPGTTGDTVPWLLPSLFPKGTAFLF